MHIGFEAPHTTEELRRVAPYLLANGFSGMEIEDHPVQPAGYLALTREIVAHYRPALSVHSRYRNYPMVFPAAKDERLRQPSLEAIRHSLMFAYQIGAPIVMVHGGEIPRQEARGEWRKYASRPEVRLSYHERLADSLVKLAALAKQLGIRLALENLPYPEHLTRSAIEIHNTLIKAGLPENLGVCLDVGHALVAGRPLEEFIELLGERIWHIHVHDNDGIDDQHLPLGRGRVQLEPVLRMLAARQPDICLLLEMSRHSTDELLESAGVIARLVQHSALLMDDCKLAYEVDGSGKR